MKKRTNYTLIFLIAFIFFFIGYFSGIKKGASDATKVLIEQGMLKTQ